MNLATLVIAVSPPTAPKSAMRAFAKVENREVFMRTIEIYTPRDQVTQRVLCVGIDDLQMVSEKYSAHLGFQGVNVTAGGPDWFGVVARGLEKLNADIDTVIIHDACRPAVPFTLLDAMEAAMEKPGVAGVVPVISVRGSFAMLNGDKTAGEWIDMAGVVEVQSPQIFKRSVLQAAYAKRAGVAAVDDAELVLQTGAAGKERVITLEGSRFNERIDGDDAVRLAPDLLGHLPKPRSKTPITPFDEAQW